MCELTPHDRFVEGALVSLGMASGETERNPTSQAEDPMWLHCSQPNRQTHTCKETHRNNTSVKIFHEHTGVAYI